jgi:hypothetical protein
MPPPRKPPGMSFQSFTDIQIEQARRDGLFDNLAGKGKPLENLGKVHDPLWWIKKLIAREGVSILPPSIRIRKTVELAMERIHELPSEAKVRSLLEELNEEIRQLNRTTISGPPTRQAVLDIDALVEKWRADRAGDRC